MNLGLLHPPELVEVACRSGAAPINPIGGFVRHVIGWREYCAVGHVHDHGYAHHIGRLMVPGNLTAGVEPWAMTECVSGASVGGAEWVRPPT